MNSILKFFTRWWRFISFTLLALLSAYEEVQQLIQRGSWHDYMTWLPIWNTDWQGFWKLLDSHHAVFGAFVLVFAFVLRLQPKNFFTWKSKFLTDTAHVVIIWYAFFYIRNLGMHIIFMNPDFIRWKYLLPIFGGML